MRVADRQDSPGEIKSREVEQGGGAGFSYHLDNHLRVVDRQDSPGEIKSRKVELGCHRELHGQQSFASLVPQQLLSGHCLCDFAAHSLLKRQLARYTSFLGTGVGPTSLTLLSWWWLTVSNSVFAGRSARTSYSRLSPPPPSPPPPPPLPTTPTFPHP